MSHENPTTFDTNSAVYKSMLTQKSYDPYFKAGDWTFTDINGVTHSLYEDYLDKGIPVVVEYFATWCGYCKSYHNTHYLSDIASNYDDVAVFMIEVANGGSESDLYTEFTKDGITSNWVDGNAANVVVLSDSEAASLQQQYVMQSPAGNYGLTGFPAVFMIASDGNAMKIASQYRTDFTDFHDMHDQVLQFDAHHDDLFNQLGLGPDDGSSNDPTQGRSTDELDQFKSLVSIGTQTAPEFVLTDIEGNSVDLYGDYLNNDIPVVLYMFATWCGYCKSYTDSGILSDLNEQFGDQVQVIMVEAASNNTTADLDSFIETYGLEDQLIIESTAINGSYGLQYFPTLFSINTAGEMINFGSVRNNFADSSDMFEEIMAFEAYGQADTAKTEPILGDINQDGALNIIDVVQTIQLILNDNPPTVEQRLISDVNADQTIDIRDVVGLVTSILDNDEDVF